MNCKIKYKGSYKSKLYQVIIIEFLKNRENSQSELIFQRLVLFCM